MGGAPEEFVLSNGEIALRDRSAEVVTQSVSVKNGSGHVKRPWPMSPCVGSGVHASDGPKLAKFLKDRGCPTEVVDGDPVYISAAHQKKALKLRDFTNKS